MSSGNHTGIQMFEKDVKETFTRIRDRCKVLRENHEKQRNEERKKAEEELESCKQSDGSYKCPKNSNNSPEIELEKEELFSQFPPNFQGNFINLI
jgi:hypothetical protein